MSDINDFFGEGKVWKTKAAFMAWVRGGIRRALWNRSPIKINFINKNRKKIVNPNPKGKVATVWGATCALCEQDFPVAQVDVDHKTGNHSLKDIPDIQNFVEGIVLVQESDLQFCCKTCHKAKSMSEKNGISFEQATAEKKAIQLIKDKLDKEWLTEKGIVPAGNQAGRRKQIVDRLMGGLDAN